MRAPQPEDYGWVQREHRMNWPAIFGMATVIAIATTVLSVIR